MPSTRTAPTTPAPARPGRVYLIHQPSVARKGPQIDLSKLSGFGEIVTLIRTGERVTRDPARALRLLSDRLRDFDPDRDFMVWGGGDTLAAFLAGVVLADQGHECIRWLWLDRPQNPDGTRDDSRGAYRPVSVPLFTTTLTQTGDS